VVEGESQVTVVFRHFSVSYSLQKGLFIYGLPSEDKYLQ